MSSSKSIASRRPFRLAFRYDSHAPWLALPVKVAAEVVNLPRLTRPVGAGLCLHGVIHDGADVAVPVFDLARWLGLAPTPDARRHAVLVDVDGARAGIVCHGEPSLLRVRADTISTRPPRALAPFVTPWGRADEGEVHEFEIRGWLSLFATPAGASPREIATLHDPGDGDWRGGALTMAPNAGLKIDQLLELEERRARAELALAQSFLGARRESRRSGA